MINEKYVGPEDVLAILPERKLGSHKGDYGRLFVIGGSWRYTGAPALVGLAALRSGVDLAIIAAPLETAHVISSFSPDLITLKLPGKNLGKKALKKVCGELRQVTALVLGPGLGTSGETKTATLQLLTRVKRDHPELPVLIDADGLKTVASKPELFRNTGWVFTPHAREFELLSGQSLSSELNARTEVVGKFARKIGCTILLKSHVDVVASPQGEVVLNSTGNPGMTVGGTGDVLSGIVGAFLAQGANPFKACVVGAYICGRAGDLCLGEKGYEFIASDLIDKLPIVFKEIRRKR
jgi:NAD(P)H-hydrate epimerase